MLTSDNPLLKKIKTTLDDIIVANKKTNAPVASTANIGFDDLMITDELRHELLNKLVTYSDAIPHPASGFINASEDDPKTKPSKTLLRWQILAYVASIDLTIAKWFESHLDAVSILYEVGYDKPVSGIWAVWASEGHPDPIHYEDSKTSPECYMSGTKAWCSGAHIVDKGLITYRDENGDAQLVAVDMHQKGIEIDSSAWQAVGMQATDTATIQFKQVTAHKIGAPNEYLDRAGFWHGAAGVAACWYGATTVLVNDLMSSYQHKPNDYKAMYLGEIGTALAVTRQYYEHAAEFIDRDPSCSHELTARTLRANTEHVARLALELVGQALGAAPYCHNAHFARLAADLPVFIRQSHGAFDLQHIGELTSGLGAEMSDKLNKNLTYGQENIWQL